MPRPFAIIEVLEGEDTGKKVVVPCTWLGKGKDGKNYVLFPNENFLKNCIDCSQPKSGWKKIHCKGISTVQSYQSGLSKVRALEEARAIGLTKAHDRKKRRSLPPKRFGTTDIDKVAAAQNNVNAGEKILHEFTVTNYNQEILEALNEVKQEIKNVKQDMQLIRKQFEDLKVSMQVNDAAQKDMDHNIVKGLRRVEYQVRLVKDVAVRGSAMTKDDAGMLPTMPIIAVDDLFKLEEMLANQDDYRKELKRKLLPLVTSIPATSVRNVVKAIASDDVWRNFVLKQTRSDDQKLSMLAVIPALTTLMQMVICDNSADLSVTVDVFNSKLKNYLRNNAYVKKKKAQKVSSEEVSDEEEEEDEEEVVFDPLDVDDDVLKNGKRAVEPEGNDELSAS